MSQDVSSVQVVTRGFGNLLQHYFVLSDFRNIFVSLLCRGSKGHGEGGEGVGPIAKFGR